MITVIGVGALGSHLIQFIRNLDPIIRVADHDRVESKNILSQFHGSQAKGRNKAFGLQQTMAGLFGTRVAALPHRLTTDNAQQILGDSTLVVDCTDNIEARQIIQSYCRANSIPCLHGALSADGSFGRIVWSGDFIPDPEGTPGQATCENGNNLPFHALVAAQMATVIQGYLTSGAKRGFQMTPNSVAVRLT